MYTPVLITCTYTRDARAQGCPYAATRRSTYVFLRVRICTYHLYMRADAGGPVCYPIIHTHKLIQILFPAPFVTGEHVNPVLHAACTHSQTHMCRVHHTEHMSYSLIYSQRESMLTPCLQHPYQTRLLLHTPNTYFMLVTSAITGCMPNPCLLSFIRYEMARRFHTWTPNSTRDG